MDKKRIALVSSLSLCIALCVACAVIALLAFGGSTKPTEIVTSSEVNVLELSADGQSYYIGTRSGSVIETDSEGNVVRERNVLSGEPVNKIMPLEDGRVLACGGGSAVCLLSSELEPIARTTLDGMYLTVDYAKRDGVDTFWFGMSSNYAYNDLYILGYTLTDGEFEFWGGNKFYTLDGDSQASFVTRNITLSADGEYLTVFARNGVIYRVSSDLELLSKDPEKLAQFHIAQYSAPDEIYSVVYDEETELFYYALRGGEIYEIGGALSPRYLCSIGDVPASIRYDRNNKRIYVPYRFYDKISVVDAHRGEIEFTFKGQFNVNHMLAYEAGNSLLVAWEDDKNVAHLSSYELSYLSRMESAKNQKIALWVLCGVFGVAAIILFLCALSETVSEKLQHGTVTFFKRLWKGKLIYLIMLPSLVLLGMFCYYPAIASIFNAFFDYSAGTAKIFSGFANFKEIFHDSYFWEMVRNMAIFTVTDCVLALAPPIFFAFCLSIMRNKNVAKGMRFALFFPGILPGIATALLWKNGIYGDYGVLNTIIKACGGREVPFLGSSKTALPSLILMGFPWVGSYLIFYGAMMNIPGEIYESAELEGCKLWRRLWSIDIPFILGQIKYVFIVTFIHSVQSLGKLQATTKGAVGTMTPMYKLYLYLNNNEYGMASAMAVLMLIVLSVCTAINMRNKIKEEASYG